MTGPPIGGALYQVWTYLSGRESLARAPSKLSFLEERKKAGVGVHLI